MSEILPFYGCLLRDEPILVEALDRRIIFDVRKWRKYLEIAGNRDETPQNPTREVFRNLLT